MNRVTSVILRAGEMAKVIGVRVLFVLGFGMLVLLMQLLAVGRLGPAASRYPWEEHSKLDTASEEQLSVHRQPVPLEHVRAPLPIDIVS